MAIQSMTIAFFIWVLPPNNDSAVSGPHSPYSPHGHCRQKWQLQQHGCAEDGLELPPYRCDTALMIWKIILFFWLGFNAIFIIAICIGYCRSVRKG